MLKHHKSSKRPTTQELYRERVRREEEERDAFLPPGLINHGNTCFMNSTLQGVRVLVLVVVSLTLLTQISHLRISHS